MGAKGEQAYQAVQRTLRAEMGKTLGPLLKRWRYTQSSDFAALPLKPAAARFFIRFGLIDAGWDEARQAEAYREFLTGAARACGEAPGVVAAWISLFAEGEYGALEKGICADEPQCGKCGLKEKCRYLATRGKEERASGENLAGSLARAQDRKLEDLSASDVLAFLVAKGKCGAGDFARAEAALKATGGLRGLFDSKSGDLEAFGYGASAQARLRAAAKLCAFWAGEQTQRGKLFLKGADFYEHFHLRLRELKKEVFYAALLDQKHALIGEERISEGSLTDTLVHPREVFALAVAKHAAAVAVVHNHPSGDPTPSTQDKAITKRLDSAAQLLGIRLLDHVIVGDGRYASFVELGLLR